MKFFRGYNERILSQKKIEDEKFFKKGTLIHLYNWFSCKHDTQI